MYRSINSLLVQRSHRETKSTIQRDELIRVCFSFHHKPPDVTDSQRIHTRTVTDAPRPVCLLPLHQMRDGMIV